MTEKKPKEKRRWLHLPARLLGGLLSLVMMALATLSLIIARPQPEADSTAAAVPQPVLTASPAMTIAAESELPELIRPFPIPVMSFMSGAGVHFVSGSSEDLAVDGGFGRVLSLFWQTEAGQPLIRFSRDKIKAAGYSDTVAVLLTNSDDMEGVELGAK